MSEFYDKPPKDIQNVHIEVSIVIASDIRRESISLSKRQLYSIEILFALSLLSHDN